MTEEEQKRLNALPNEHSKVKDRFLTHAFSRILCLFKVIVIIRGFLFFTCSDFPLKHFIYFISDIRIIKTPSGVYGSPPQKHF